MFNKLKQVKDLRAQAKTMQNSLAGESVTIEKKGIKITMDGNMAITNLEIDPNMSNDAIASNMKTALNEAIKKTQKLMAEKMQSMGGLGNLGL
ncbi:MAG: YbaB/EbfC family nucleoid-associated protein [Patescibacteria group bacterium]|nr:YbaB/EbfC family nucleoid-associated protein [Patescibacteria group bacterium]